MPKTIIWVNALTENVEVQLNSQGIRCTASTEGNGTIRLEFKESKREGVEQLLNLWGYSWSDEYEEEYESCPNLNCQSGWGIEEIDFQQCDSCGWPNVQEDEPDLLEDEYN